ncbi:tetratricopeptide repeat protein [Clostridium tagluense]|uniref:tetratricopeptide repeat protein n=1 Tax=Clostridium tagluense TaxID=360422 RepID=UPI001CF0EFD7|nr:SEC-C metal-binding domain-containing protein [Clostridium tagluense]MCB2300284.1 SEC-C domain-containing protein [Clostridium tagluense]
MAISIIALNRMIENSLIKKEISEMGLENKRRTVLSDIRRLEDEILIDRLNSFGVDMEKAAFFETIKKHLSSEAYYIWLMDVKKLKIKKIDENMLWMCLTVLWERWFPEIPNFEMVDDKIYAGYMLFEKREYAEACNLWWDVWNDIIYIMDHHGISGISEFDNKFRGSQSLFNWSSDFDMELYNASIDNENFLEKRLEFCSEYVKRSEDKRHLNIENMKRIIGESYIGLGRSKEGDAVFESYLSEDPKWGWAWISWSDSYWMFNGNKQNDFQKAEAILKKALIIEGLRDRASVMKRLMNFYEKTGREEEEHEIQRELNQLRKNKQDLKNNIQPILLAKVGRNDPCPCESGKKYKKCCGK